MNGPPGSTNLALNGCRSMNRNLVYASISCSYALPRVHPRIPCSTKSRIAKVVKVRSAFKQNSPNQFNSQDNQSACLSYDASRISVLPPSIFGRIFPIHNSQKIFGVLNCSTDSIFTFEAQPHSHLFMRNLFHTSLVLMENEIRSISKEKLTLS